MALENQTLAQSMVRLFMGHIPTRVIYVAAKLELTDHIGYARSNRARPRDRSSKSIAQPCIVSCACSQALACLARR